MSNASSPVNKPFGLWKSPISAFQVSQRTRLNDVQWSGQTLLWLEGRSDRTTLVAHQGGEAARELSGQQNVRGTIGYGGGEFSAGLRKVIFAERNGQLFQRGLGYGQPKAITPLFGHAAAPALSPDEKWVIYVFSDGHTDLLGLVDSEGHKWPIKWVQGADFYMQPTWHPDARYIAWVEWDHPNMPWDGTRLMLAQLETGDPPVISEITQIDGDAQVPAWQPEFSPDGRYLSYITNRGEWHQLNMIDLKSREKQVLLQEEPLLLAPPAWVHGIRTYGWHHSSRSIIYTRSAAGSSNLWQIEVGSKQNKPIDVSPYTTINQLSISPVDDQFAFIGSAPAIPQRIVCWNGHTLVVEARSDAESTSPDFLPPVQPISWQAPDGSRVHGLYHPPTNPEYTYDGLPPAIIYIHGGPTSQVTSDYAPEMAYFTSRGYGWLDVNYRGSTGYGRSYQDSLRQRWGQIDVEDAIGGAQALIDHQLADQNRLIIRGGSAGGYTVLNALARHPGFFKAGICLFGVSNLFTLAMETHKFEERYLDSMVGTLPESSKKYHDWSPIFFANQIRDPLMIFQGAEDVVVPPNQSEEIVKELQRNGVPHQYKRYEGEGHGFRKSETVADFLNEVERFLFQHVLFAG